MALLSSALASPGRAESGPDATPRVPEGTPPPPIPGPGPIETAPAVAPEPADDDDAPSSLDDWSFIPIVFYTPETSIGFGAAVIYSFDVSNHTAPSLSTLAGGIIVTGEEQVIARIEPDVRFEDVLMHGFVRFQRYPTRFFGPGGHPGDAGEPYDESTLSANLDTRYRLARPGELLDTASVGGRCDLAWNEIVGTREGGVLEAAHPLGLRPFVALGCGPVLAIDSRDDVRLPTRGVYAEARASVWSSLYGPPFQALMADLDVRGFLDLGAGHVLAGQVRFRTTEGALPFQLLPRLGGTNHLRGWFDGHLRDQNAILLQLEWRLPIVWKIGAAIFASTGQAFHRYRDMSFDDFRFAAGAGLRFLFNKKQTVSVRCDVAYGSDIAVYVDVLEAF